MGARGQVDHISRAQASFTFLPPKLPKLSSSGFKDSLRAAKPNPKLEMPGEVRAGQRVGTTFPLFPTCRTIPLLLKIAPQKPFAIVGNRQVRLLAKLPPFKAIPETSTEYFVPGTDLGIGDSMTNDK